MFARKLAVSQRKSTALRSLLALGLLIGCGQAALSADADDQWPLIGKGPTAQHYADFDAINPGNVGQLGFAFEFRDFVVRGRTHRGVQATPLMIDGVLYFSGPWGVAYAVDARTGRSLWTYDPEADGSAARNSCCDVVNRGVAVADGRLFVAASDGQLAAVDLKTGKELWKVATITDRRWNTSNTDKPIVANGLVVIGNAGADMGSRGYISAYHAETGKLAWRFWVVPSDPAAGPDEGPEVTAARATWPADTRWELGLGGNTWSGITYDPATDTVFAGTGNGGPHPAWLRSKSGEITDQLYLSSIVALDRASGRIKWHYQTTPGDSWDFNASSPFVLADVTVAGKPRKVLMQAPKNGFFYMLDRTTGELLTAQPFTEVTWASHVDMKTGRPVLNEAGNFRNEPKVIWPGIPGAHSWTPMAYSPRTGLAYFQVYQGGASYIADAEGVLRRGAISQSMNGGFAPFDDPRLQKQFEEGPNQRVGGALKAIDPVTGKIRWTVADLPPQSGGALVSGDVVFHGDANGYLSAYEAATGKRLLHLFTGTSILGAPITYRLDGVQYIAFLAGWGGPQGGFFPPGSPGAEYQNFERLIVLKLGGSAVPLPPRQPKLALPPLPAPIRASAATLAHGQKLYEQYCHRCHLTGGAPGNYPNLWQMPRSTVDAFELIVGEGALEYAGMGNFSDALTRADRDAIKAFIVTDTITKRTAGTKAGAQFKGVSH